MRKIFGRNIHFQYIAYQNCLSLQLSMQLVIKVYRGFCSTCRHQMWSRWRSCTRNLFNSNQTQTSHSTLFFNDLFLLVTTPSKCFPRNGIGFWGQSKPKFQDLNIDNNINEIFGCFEVSSWVLIPLISSTSPISSSTFMGVPFELWWFLQSKIVV